MARSPCLGLLTRTHCGPDVEKKISQPLGRQLDLYSVDTGGLRTNASFAAANAQQKTIYTNCRPSPRRPPWVVGSASPTTPLHRHRDKALGLSVPSPWGFSHLGIPFYFFSLSYCSSFLGLPSYFLFFTWQLDVTASFV